MGVLMQAFYWDCPGREGRHGAWWSHVETRVADLARAGITALWLPPVSKGMNAGGMGYDPYDFYDLGEHDQKGGVETWFGTKDRLLSLIGRAHAHGVEVYADLVLNHCSGADEQETNPITGEKGWTKFSPASGRFARDWTCFHPCDYESWDDAPFAGFPDLCHRNPRVFGEILEYARWLVEEIGFDGFRYDFVKGFGYRGRGAWVVTAIQEFRYRRRGSSYHKPFGVVEHWSEPDPAPILEYLQGANYWSDNEVAAFDFPLRHRLARLCGEHGFSLRELTESGTVLAYDPRLSVPFVENHDTAGSHPIVNEKLLAYAFLLTHEGYPCVFWEDWFRHGLARSGSPRGLEALVSAHEGHAHGPTDVLHVDDDLYVMQRRGDGGRGGLVFVLNNSGIGWNGRTVRTAFPGARFEAVAFDGRDPGHPEEKWTDGAGRADFWAPPRGYAVYAPLG